MRAGRLYGVLAILVVAAPAVAEELPGGWVTGTLMPRLKGTAPQAGALAAPVSVGELDCGSFTGDACIVGDSLVNAVVPAGQSRVAEMPVTQGFLRHFLGPNASCSTIGHRAAVEIDSTRNGDLEVLFGLRGGAQLPMYDNPAGCNGDDLDVTFRNGAGAANACKPAPGAELSPVQSLIPLNGVAIAGNSYLMTVRDTVANNTTRFLVAGHETDLNCVNAVTQTVCPGVAASAISAATFTESILGGTPQPHLSPGALTACLLSGQYAVAVYYEAHAGFKGQANMVPLTDEITASYFINPANLEVFVKLRPDCAGSGKVWVFIGGLTNLRIIVTITHMPTGFTRYYINPPATLYRTVADTTLAFDC